MSESIKFKHAPDGEILVRNGSTSFADLFTIGAVSLCFKRVWDGDNSHTEYATDEAGLELVSMKAELLTSYLHGAVRDIGILLAHADHKEIEHDMVSIAWLIAGLGELAEMVSLARCEIDFHLDNKPQANKKPR